MLWSSLQHDKGKGGSAAAFSMRTRQSAEYRRHCTAQLFLFSCAAAGPPMEGSPTSWSPAKPSPPMVPPLPPLPVRPATSLLAAARRSANAAKEAAESRLRLAAAELL